MSDDVLELSRGANTAIPSPLVTVSVACDSPVDVSALLVGADGKVRQEADFIFYNHPTGPGVTYLPAAQGPRGVDAVRVDAVRVDTTALPPDVDRVVVTASLDGSGPATFAQAGHLVVTVLDAAGGDAIRFALTGLTTEAALVCAEVYRRNGAWKVRAVGQGYDNGLAGIATEYGIEVEEPAAPVAAPVASPVAAPAAGQRVNLDKGKVSLRKQQTVSLVKTGAPALTRVAMGLGWDPASGRGSIDLDASVIAFDGWGKDLDTVWFMSKQGCKGAIRHAGDNLTGVGDADDEVITVELDKLPAEVAALVFTVNSFGGQKFTAVANAYCRLLDARSTPPVELVRFELSDSSNHTGVLMCKLVRQDDGTWSMTGLGTFSDGKTVKKMIGPARAAL